MARIQERFQNVEKLSAALLVIFTDRKIAGDQLHEKQMVRALMHEAMREQENSSTPFERPYNGRGLYASIKP